MARYVIKWNERQNDAELVQQKKTKTKRMLQEAMPSSQIKSKIGGRKS